MTAEHSNDIGKEKWDLKMRRSLVTSEKAISVKSWRTKLGCQK